jgi:type II secretory pathway component PulF
VVLFPLIAVFRTGRLAPFFLTVLGILLPIYAAAAFLLMAGQGRHGEQWRSRMEQILQPVPLLGSARRCLALARLAAALEALLRAGVVITTAWDLAVAASGSPALGRAVRAWKEPLEAGSTPAELVRQSPEFPELFSSLYHSGEISGQLDETLGRLHTLYQDEGIGKMRSIARWAPRLVYYLVILLVAWQIISSYLGLYGHGSDLDKVLNGN